MNETYPIHYEDTPAYAYYPSKERNSEYRESLYVGYRYYTTVGKEVRFTIKNTGDRDGVEVPQLYVALSSNTVFRPIRELKGFARVELKTGEEKEGRYSEETLPNYFAGNIAKISDDEFKLLYGKELPDGTWGGEIGINDAFCQFYYAKGTVARLVYRVLKGQLDKAMKRGEPNLDILFIFNMPIRGISRMTGGMVNMKMVYGITEIANGHFFKGIGKVISEFIKG